ncbi:uncharacterized protein LOC118515280 [Anopheles stephensi]|uniref:uncharacterized protein LOC118515280 n=1 Tax=Anopheles stephensi TaxID=30069 RepID=UPI001658AB64|nr:uncharacterized protein LOC118515280 [Anopheles stephensi]
MRSRKKKSVQVMKISSILLVQQPKRSQFYQANNNHSIICGLIIHSFVVFGFGNHPFKGVWLRQELLLVEVRSCNIFLVGKFVLLSHRERIQYEFQPKLCTRGKCKQRMQAPRRRKTTSNEDRERVVTAYENGATAATISEMFNLKKPTVHGIIKKYQTQWQIEVKKSGGNRSKLLSQPAVNDVRNWIDEDCTVTLKALAEKVFEQHGVRVSSTTIAREIKGFNYSLKMVKLLPERRNTTTTVEERKHYATQFYEIAREIPDNGLIYLDEVGFNVTSG